MADKPIAISPDATPRFQLHQSAFEYLKPSETQMAEMAEARRITAEYASYLEDALPDGPDKTYILRKLREIGMWINVTITREANGKPRT